MEREGFKSRLGFILVSSGCAIGIGNVWRFPYVVGQNGGGIFVAFYLLFLLIMGVPVLTMELAVGRASRKNAVLGYKALEKEGSKWHIHGWICMLGCYLLMMYYTTVSGWMTDYLFKFASGSFKNGMTSEEIGNVFQDMLSSPSEMILWMAVVVIAGFFICSFGLQKGIERISKYLMSALLLLIVVLAVHSFTLPEAGRGLSFYLVPDMEKVKSIGLGKIIVAAMNQSFFTLSLGIAAMEILGSYMSRKNTLPSEAVRISLLDTFVAIMSGLIIFPACFSFGIEPTEGPALIFVTLPNVFTDMPGGRIWGALFFLLMTFASFSTIIAVFKNIVAFCEENFGLSRKRSAFINCIAVLVLSLPCVLGFNALSGLSIGGRNVLDMEDYIVSNLMLPLGSLVFLLFCVTKWGWGFDNYYEECNSGKGLRFPRILKPFFQFVLPVLIIIILVQCLI
ncbi:MAG: sodium-dependent transporter [Ruminococcus sp.]|nr:sodium-dependent transporter [Ruminococcus sp.]